ncbi:MAG: arylamine N-acetyltransferase family protein [Panacagrimonas sp.]
MPHPADGLAPALLERVLTRLGLSTRPAPTFSGLSTLYAAWCPNVPFDNIRKLIHLRRGDPGPLPGDSAEDFFESWLRYGTGATCWAGHGALHALLGSLGFASVRGFATMMLAPNIPPNHATVVVACEGKRYLVDASILHGEPLEISESAPTAITHPAWGARFGTADGQRIIHWRPLHMPQGLNCRIDKLDVPAEVFRDFHERSRAWSPFNYQLYARVNRGGTVIGTAFGQRIEFDASGNAIQRDLEVRERLRFLVEDLGIHEEIAALVPADIPTPPPPSAEQGT